MLGIVKHAMPSVSGIFLFDFYYKYQTLSGSFPFIVIIWFFSFIHFNFSLF